VRPGDVLDVVIEKGVYRGRGLARPEGGVVLVPRAHPGDRVRVRLTGVHAGWAEGVLVAVLEPAPERRRSPCPWFPRCGGCAYQDLSYEGQLRLKESVLRESLARAGVPWKGPVSVHPSPESGWRMRASLHFATGEEGLRLGLQQEGTRRVVDVEACLQLSERMNRAARSVHRALLERRDLWRRLRGLGLLGERVPELEGFGAAAGRTLHWLHGPAHVEATVAGVLLRAHARSFFQANRFLIEPLARAVVDLVPRGASRVIDLYAGVGLFALPLAARGEPEVVAVEWARAAAEDARWGAKRNGLSQVRVIEADVETALSGVRPEAGERIVLDPPRTGVGPEVVKLLADRRPEAIVYVSCDPPTLGRDLARLGERGYRPDTVHLFDLFPDTFHMESVVRLGKA
jgi:23S rRNA (uracil1939-C5)-methyltransferase